MDVTVLIFLASGLFLGWSLGANDAANVFGTAVGTRMVRFATAALVCSVFVALGAVVSGSGAAHTLGELGAINALPGSFMAALSAAATVYGMTRMGLPVSTSQAIVGAIIGWNLFSGSVTDTATLVKIVSTWVACPLLAGAIAVPLFGLTRRFLLWANFHLYRLDTYTRLALILAGAFGSYSLGANNIANVMGVFVAVSPFTEFTLWGEHRLSSVQQLFLLGAIAIAVGVFTYSKRVMLTVGTAILPLTPVAAWVVVVAHSITLFLFASEGLEHALASAGLPTVPLVPVSSSQAVVGAVIGLGLLRGATSIDWRMLGGIGVGWVTTPVISALMCFIGLFFLQNVFDQQVSRDARYVMSLEVLNRLGPDVVAEPLAEVRDREFSSAQDFLSEFRRRAFVTREAERAALRYAEVGNFPVDPEKIEALDRRVLSAEQIRAVESLVGRTFHYKWRLEEALAMESDEWKRKEDITLNKRHNRNIERKLEHLYRTLAVD